MQVDSHRVRLNSRANAIAFSECTYLIHLALTHIKHLIAPASRFPPTRFSDGVNAFFMPIDYILIWTWGARNKLATLNKLNHSLIQDHCPNKVHANSRRHAVHICHLRRVRFCIVFEISWCDAIKPVSTIRKTLSLTPLSTRAPHNRDTRRTSFTSCRPNSSVCHRPNIWGASIPLLLVSLLYFLVASSHVRRFHSNHSHSHSIPGTQFIHSTY